MGGDEREQWRKAVRALSDAVLSSWARNEATSTVHMLKANSAIAIAEHLAKEPRP